ncbi:maestro heat-like repeat-containing protein family member 7 [Erinaceus europaeus]|uniref:Maestro heat-like repeat-containing protein family member 7 n=1 Tax=Erinaceus europaeus TaxID=9365 RepID=A0ABM3WD50_ERIEU|nr:maestro heat-like repeat-containing protein family member 7 [Erinaceus europaeus]
MHEPSGKGHSRVTFAPIGHILTGLRQSEQEAYQFILEFIDQGNAMELDKLKFLRAVETLSDAVRYQADANINKYFPKVILAKKIEAIILEEPTENLTSNVCQQAMLCIVALSQVNPQFYLPQKLDLVSAAITSVFPLPLITPSPDRKESASLYLQTIQAFDEMLQALVMEHMEPSMFILQNILEIILPWLTQAEKVHEQTRALGAMARMLRFLCNFPELSHMAEFTVSGKLVGTLGLYCIHHQAEVSSGAAETLHYLFKVLVLQRSLKQKTETILKNLQKNFRGDWSANIQNLTMFFRSYLTPNERADMILVLLEAMTKDNPHGVDAASKVLRTVMKYSMPEIGKVPVIIQFIYQNLNRITNNVARGIVKKVLHLLAQNYTDQVILTLVEIEDHIPRGICKPWEILSSFPKGYEMILEYLLQNLTTYQQPSSQEPDQRAKISLRIATRAIHELLLEPDRRLEVQTIFPSMFMALLYQMSFLVVEGGAQAMQDEQQSGEWVDLVSTTLETMKSLMRSSGYGELVSYIQKLEGWELLIIPERHYEGVTVLARVMVLKNCWHSRPIFSLIIRILQQLNCTNHITSIVLLIELVRCPSLAAMMDDVATQVLGNWFQCEEPATVKLLLQVVEIFAKHGTMARQIRILQPHVFKCCYSLDSDLVMETFLLLHRLLEHLSWQNAPSFLTQLAFTLGSFFEEESESLRVMAFEIYGALLAKVKRRILVFPLRHQVLNLIVLLVLHLLDENSHVAQICRLALCHTATILGWARLKVTFAERDTWSILRALLEQEASKALWFLRQSLALFNNPQTPIRQAAVWFSGQVIQILSEEETSDIDDVYSALRQKQRDPEPTVSCLATQIFYILEVKERRLSASPALCFCHRRS